MPRDRPTTQLDQDYWRCLHCDYDLRATMHRLNWRVRCPECGRISTRLKMIRRLKDRNRREARLAQYSLWLLVARTILPALLGYPIYLGMVRFTDHEGAAIITVVMFSIVYCLWDCVVLSDSISQLLLHKLMNSLSLLVLNSMLFPVLFLVGLGIYELVSIVIAFIPL